MIKHKSTITLTTSCNANPTVEAELIGPFAIHRTYKNKKTWTLTHALSGRRLFNSVWLNRKGSKVVHLRALANELIGFDLDWSLSPDDFSDTSKRLVNQVLEGYKLAVGSQAASYNHLGSLVANSSALEISRRFLEGESMHQLATYYDVSFEEIENNLRSCIDGLRDADR